MSKSSGAGSSYPQRPTQEELGYISQYDEERSRPSSFIQQCKDFPFLPAGIIGGVSALLYSAYNLRHRNKNEKLSVYLIHTRVAAQGAVVGALALGVTIKLITDYLIPEIKDNINRNKKPH